MMNNPAVLSTARTFAGGLLKQRRTDGVLVDALYRKIVGPPPSDEEQRLSGGHSMKPVKSSTACRSGGRPSKAMAVFGGICVWPCL
ncbi:MAG: hypothetical protein Ct9H300mP1_30330 [Planctomycetaceae bacterium]|nr:MAG: hypothetical protein Ct9H300mP1_30330 [Planctomycetaceae bacterium]